MSWQGDDLSILSITDDRVEMTNISPERGMVNSYLVENTDLWIPNGMGWYPVNRLGLIVKGDDDLARRVVFYNFGFWPKKVVIGYNWRDNRQLFSMLGGIGFLRYRLLSDDWLWRKETLKTDNLAEIMPRDMSDRQILAADIKLNVINATGKNGLGNMIADRLEWFGLMVTSVQTFEPQKTCQIFFDNLEKEKMVANALAKIFGCELVNRVGLLEMVLGTDMEEVIKYSQTYVRSF